MKHQHEGGDEGFCHKAYGFSLNDRGERLV